MAGVAIQFGYVDPDGLNDAVLVSPSVDDTGTALAGDVIAAFNQMGVEALWVAGEPDDVAADIAQQLDLPVGVPDGWFGAPADPDPESATPASPNRAQRRAEHVHDWKLAGINPKLPGGGTMSGKVYRCSGCPAMQVKA